MWVFLSIPRCHAPLYRHIANMIPVHTRYSLFLALAVAPAEATVVLRDDFIDDADGTLPQIRLDQDGAGLDEEDIGLGWFDLGGPNAAVVESANLNLHGAAGSGIDAGIRGSFVDVNPNEVFSVSFDVSFGSGQVGTHLAIVDILVEDLTNKLVTGGTGFFGVRLIKGGDIESWSGSTWTYLGTTADFSGQTVDLVLYEGDYSLVVAGTTFSGIAYAASRPAFNQIEFAFAGNNGSQSSTGLIEADNLGVIP